MSALGAACARLFRRADMVDAGAWEALEDALVAADVGARTAASLVKIVRARKPRDAQDARVALAEALRARLAPLENPYRPPAEGMAVILTSGVNGAGKTTFVARFARLTAQNGRKPLVVGADTWRAGAGEQLARWCERLGLAHVLGARGRDPAAAVHDACARPRAEGLDTLIVDTAGRLHSEQGLMDQLDKIARVLERAAPDAASAGFLVMDASLGRGAWRVAQSFRAAGRCSHAVITKMDSDARAGFALDLADADDPLPIAYLSVGAGDDALVPFDARAFAAAMTQAA